MKTVLAVLVAASASLSAVPEGKDPGKKDPQEGFFCRVGVFTPAERKRHQELSERLKQAAQGMEERAKGYAFRLDPKRVGVLELAEWIDGERRCCPFFDLELEVEPQGAALWLKLSGAEGVKAFIRDEMGLAAAEQMKH